MIKISYQSPVRTQAPRFLFSRNSEVYFIEPVPLFVSGAVLSLHPFQASEVAARRCWLRVTMFLLEGAGHPLHMLYRYETSAIVLKGVWAGWSKCRKYRRCGGGIW